MLRDGEEEDETDEGQFVDPLVPPGVAVRIIRISVGPGPASQTHVKTDVLEDESLIDLTLRLH